MHVKLENQTRLLLLAFFLYQADLLVLICIPLCSVQLLQEAICPERRFAMDNQLSAVASITSVYVSNDMQVVKVYVSIYSDERGKSRAMANLKRLEP